jgi:hypothetical protein
MIALRDPVALSRVDDELVLDPELAQRAVEVRRLAERHVRVVLAGHDQHRLRTDGTCPFLRSPHILLQRMPMPSVQL